MATVGEIEIDEELVAEASRLGIDVRNLLEVELRQAIRKRQAANAWYAENREAIDAYNRYIEEHGVFGEEFRSYG